MESLAYWGDLVYIIGLHYWIYRKIKLYGINEAVSIIINKIKILQHKYNE